MPITFPAHQGLVVLVKLRWPRAVDGTALCIGAATPDLAYPLGSWMSTQSHTLLGLLVWSLPASLVIATLVRWRAADGLFANLPDLGRLRLRSYRVLGRRKPPIAITVVSAFVGSASHVVIDGFTHQGRWGANALALNDVLGTVPFRGEMTEARLLQYLGHFGGSLLFVGALMVIGSTGRLERWYGETVVAEAREAPGTWGGPTLFWAPVFTLIAVAAGVGQWTDRSVIFLPVLAAAVSTVTVGTVFGRSH